MEKGINIGPDPKQLSSLGESRQASAEVDRPMVNISSKVGLRNNNLQQRSVHLSVPLSAANSTRGNFPNVWTCKFGLKAPKGLG